MYCWNCSGVNPDDARFCGSCGSDLAMLGQLLFILRRHPKLSVRQGPEADIEVQAVLADAGWLIGKKKVMYEACLTLNGAAKTVIFWEWVKEVGAGMAPLFSFKLETYKSDGKTISGTVKEKGFGPSGAVINYEWDYSQVRCSVEAAVKDAGWRFETTLSRTGALRGQK